MLIISPFLFFGQVNDFEKYYLELQKSFHEKDIIENERIDYYIERNAQSKRPIDGAITFTLTLGAHSVVVSTPQAVALSRFAIDGMEFKPPNEHMFSFNNPLGACPNCEGHGDLIGIDEQLVVPNTSLSVFGGAVISSFSTMVAPLSTISCGSQRLVDGAFRKGNDFGFFFKRIYNLLPRAW